jgi:predicted DNA-binding transcriptional regulator YafY
MTRKNNTFNSAEGDTTDIAQQKLLGVLQLIRLLKEPGGHTMKQLQEHTAKKLRTLQRYLRLLDEVGYPVEKSFGRPARYFLFEPEGSGQRYLPLNPAEADLLSRRLADLGTAEPALPGLRQKLCLPGLLLPQPHELRGLRLAHILDTLALGISLRRQVRLLAYESGNSGTISDRVVEPLALANGSTQLACNDVTEQGYRTYNLSRMGGAELLDTPCTLPDPGTRPDAFGLGEAADRQPVELLLTKRAYQQLLRESAEAAADCQQTASGQYRYRGWVNGFHGVGRFVLGLPLEVHIAAPDALREFVRDKVARATW